MLNGSPTHYFQSVGVLLSNMSLLREEIVGSCFFIQSETLGLLMGSLSPFTFRVTIDRYEFSVIMISIQSLFLWIVALNFFLKGNFKSPP